MRKVGRHRRTTTGRHRRPVPPLLQPPTQAGPAVAAGLTALVTVAAGAVPAATAKAEPAKQSAASASTDTSDTAVSFGSKGAAALSAQLGLQAEKPDLEAVVKAAAALSTATAGTFDRDIEDHARYEAESGCSGEVQPGLVALRDQLKSVFGGADANYGTLRACSDNLSGHEEGRALDWMVDARDPAERAAGLAFLQWLLATDGDGNEHANARRLGVMYVIWNDRIWSAGQAEEGWRPYTHYACPGGASACSPTLRHLDHIHLSLSHAGAAKTTTFWTARAQAPGVLPGSLGEFPGQASTGRGDRNEHVLRYERRLHALGLLEEELVDERMGRATLEASRELQRQAGLVVDGVVGPLTWAAADAAVPAPVLQQPPDAGQQAGTETD